MDLFIIAKLHAYGLSETACKQCQITKIFELSQFLETVD